MSVSDVLFRAFWTHSSQVKCVKGGDGHPWLLWRHKNLMLLFFRSVYRVLSDTGRICVSTGIRSWSAADRFTAPNSYFNSTRANRNLRTRCLDSDTGYAVSVT